MKMNRSKMTKTVISVAAVIVFVTIVVTASLIFGGKTPPQPPTDSEMEASTDVVVEPPIIETASEVKSDDQNNEPNPDHLLDVSGEPVEGKDDPTNSNTSQPAVDPEKPVEQVPPGKDTTPQPEPKPDPKPTPDPKPDPKPQPKPDPTPTPPDQVTKYDCGYPGHTCKNAAHHEEWLEAMAENEKTVCRHCGKRDCEGKLDQTKCPQYDTKKDPTVYCQDCGKQKGRGLDKCRRFLLATNCPDCGEYVEGQSCHSCG